MHMMHVLFPAFYVFLWQRYSTTYWPGIITTGFWVVFCFYVNEDISRYRTMFTRMFIEPANKYCFRKPVFFHVMYLHFYYWRPLISFLTNKILIIHNLSNEPLKYSFMLWVLYSTDMLEESQDGMDSGTLSPPSARQVTIKRHPTQGFGFIAGSQRPVIVRSVSAG